jgi:hypothetical protein
LRADARARNSACALADQVQFRLDVDRLGHCADAALARCGRAAAHARPTAIVKMAAFVSGAKSR